MAMGIGTLGETQELFAGYPQIQTKLALLVEVMLHGCLHGGSG